MGVPVDGVRRSQVQKHQRRQGHAQGEALARGDPLAEQQPPAGGGDQYGAAGVHGEGDAGGHLVQRQQQKAAGEVVGKPQQQPEQHVPGDGALAQAQAQPRAQQQREGKYEAQEVALQRWISIGPISIQPSEFSKLIMIVCLASVLEERVGKLNTLDDLMPVAAYIGVPFLLVLKQPDLGTSLVFMAIFFGMVFVSGIRLKLLFGIFGVGIAALPILWHFLKDYQKMRIMVFMDPNVDPLGSGYHIIQSKIAIGSGMLFGKGLFEGTQSQLNFLPENHTDFIFAVVGEELGFIGAVCLLLLYLVVLWRGVQIAREAVDVFGRLMAVGITSMFAFHVLVNVGMTMGIMPVTGIPLPLMSYGVSSLITNIMAIAILMNIQLRKQKLLF